MQTTNVPIPPGAAPVGLGPLLRAVEDAPPAEGVDALAGQLADALGASAVSMLIADDSGASLVRLARRAPPERHLPARAAQEHVPVVGTPAGESFTSQQTTQSHGQDGTWVHVPVTERGEALGVLELLLPTAPEPWVLDHLRAAGHALAFVVLADRRFSDLYELAQRSTPLALEAEIQRRLLPPSYACEGPQFSLAGWLVPADEAGGDTFDYMVERDVLHLSITDAMGHGVQAAQLATLGVGSLRNSRRQGMGLAAQAERASRHIAEHADPDQFVTALLGRLDLRTGALDLVNAGHMNPLLVREGQVAEIALDPGIVLGVLPGQPYAAQTVVLRPGDRLVLVTDGMSERGAAAAEIDQLLPTLQHLHPRRAAQALTGAVLHVTGGSVRDDATVLVLDWHGGTSTPRRTSPYDA